MAAAVACYATAQAASGNLVLVGERPRPGHFGACNITCSGGWRP